MPPTQRIDATLAKERFVSQDHGGHTPMACFRERLLIVLDFLQQGLRNDQ